MKNQYLTRPILDVCPMSDFSLNITERQTREGRMILFESLEGVAHLIRYNYDYNSGYLCKLEVNSQKRKRGVGRLLIQAVFNYCLDHNIQRVYGLMAPLHATAVRVTRGVLEKVYTSYGFNIQPTVNGPEISVEDLRAHFRTKLESPIKQARQG